MDFGFFAGNDKLKESLSEIVEKGRVPHTIIFEGRKGLGKKTLARIFASALLCRSILQRPCGKCPDCVKFSDNSHPDVTFVDGTDPKAISVDSIRELRSDAFIKPNEGGKKVCVITDADKMGLPSQNALLKILEEPPEYCVFIFTCENRSSFLPTILSRAAVFEVFPPAEDEAEKAVMRACPEADAEDVKKAVRLFSGNIGDSISSLGKGRFAEIYDVSFALLNSLTATNEMDFLEKTAVFDSDKEKEKEKCKELFKSCVSLMSLAVRDAAVRRYGARSSISGLDMNGLSGFYSLTSRQLLALYEELCDISQTIDRSPNYTLLITRFCARLRAACGR